MHVKYRAGRLAVIIMPRAELPRYTVVVLYGGPEGRLSRTFSRPSRTFPHPLANIPSPPHERSLALRERPLANVSSDTCERIFAPSRM